MLNCYKTGKEEAQGISDIIEKIKKIFFKQCFNIGKNNLSNSSFEERFSSGIGYRVLGGIKFYERSEIKMLFPTYELLIKNLMI